MSEDIQKEVIQKIKHNRISTTEIADVLGKTGALEGIKPLNQRHFAVGRVHLIYGHNESNWGIHEQIHEQNIKKEDIIICEMFNCNNKAAFGELVTKFLILYKGVTGIVVNGTVRDAHRLIKEDYPIWCSGYTPIGCKNKKTEQPIDSQIIEAWKQKYEGTIAVCDDSGVVIIPKDQINEAFLEKLDFIELQEDIWFHCVDTKKWSTYDTVCLKKYLDNTEFLPKELRERFESFIKKTE